MQKTNNLKLWILGSTAFALVSWLGFDIYRLASTFMEARAVIVRCLGVLFVALLVGILLWMFYYRRYTLRTFVIVVPALAALCAVPLPYLTSARSLRQRLDQAGIVYTLEPSAFESQLDWLTVTLLGPKFSGLYATKLVTLEVHLDRCDSLQISTLPGVERLSTVVVVRSSKGGHVDAAVVGWLNSLPDQVITALVISHLEPSEIDCVKNLHRQKHFALFKDMDADRNISGLLREIEADIIQFEGVHFAENFDVGPDATTCRRLNLMDCNLNEEQISPLAHAKRCVELSISGCGPISETQFGRLADQPQLKLVEFNPSRLNAGLSSTPSQLGIDRLRAAGKVVYAR